MKLKVEKMSCGHCASSVGKAVRAVDPAADVAVDLRAGTVSVTSQSDGALISEAIRAAGYPAVVVAG